MVQLAVQAVCVFGVLNIDSVYGLVVYSAITIALFTLLENIPTVRVLK